MVIESGPLVSLRYAREATHGVTPAGIGTTVDPIAADATGTGTSKFTRASGSFLVDGFVAGQRVTTAGFTNPTNNATWIIQSVIGGEIVVVDTGDVIITEAAAGGKSVRILMVEIRATARAVNLEKNILESAEVRADRQKSDVRHGFNRVVGSPGFELSLQSFDELLELMLGRAWVAVTAVSGVNIGINTGTKIIDRASGSFITDGYRKGDIVRTTGFANSANNADWMVLTVAALQLTVADPDGVIVTEAAAGARTVTYPGKRLDVGTVLSTMTVERAFAGIVQYQVFKGVCVNQGSISVRPEAIVGGTMTLLGMSASPLSGTPISAVDPFPRPITTPFAAFDGKMFEGTGLIAVATSVDLAFANNRALAPVIGSKFSPDVFEGTVDLTGTLTALFETAALLNKFINETESSMYIKLQDPQTPTNFMVLVFPRVKYTGGMIDPPQEGPVPISMPYRALVQTGLAAAGGASVSSCFTIQRSNTN